MACSPKIACLLVVFLIVAVQERVESAVSCPGSNPDDEAFKLVSCLPAAKDGTVKPSTLCCNQINSFPSHGWSFCLCAALISKTAKDAGIKPEIAISIPKRCGLKNHSGYKCAGYVVP